MTPELLKQAREALWDAAQELHHIDSGPIKELGGVIAKVEDAAAALTAFDSLSDYDKIVKIFAETILPKWATWCALDPGHRSGMALCYGNGEPKLTEKNQFNELHWWSSEDDFDVLPGIMTHVENLPPFRESLRRITHNSDGTVTVERG